MSTTSSRGGGWLGLLRSVGPAIIVASVVLGPGSILTSSKVGTAFGMQLLWVVLLAGLLMAGTVALSARLGVTLEHSLCDEVAARLGRPVAVLLGLSVFLIVACFQFSNNVAILAAVEPMLEQSGGADANSLAVVEQGGAWVSAIVLLSVNALIIVALFGMSRLYTGVEWLMKALVLVMAVAFIVNLAFAGPSLVDAARGLLPTLPEEMSKGWWPARGGGKTVNDPLWAVQGLFATTFSIAGAFYQSYLVREKGWTNKDLGRGLFDSILGITILAGLTSVVLMTSATVLHGRIEVAELGSVADVARQLQPVFGDWAMYLFSAGILAGAFSSFLVNAMVGGTLMADGLGLGSRMTDFWPKYFTVVALVMGCGVAIWVTSTGERPVQLIVFAQALTVLGLPMLAAVMLYLACSRGSDGKRFPLTLQGVAVVSLVVVLFLAARTMYNLYLTLVPSGT